MTNLLLIVLLLGAVALAETTAAPQLSLDRRAKLWRALAEFNGVKPTYERAQAKLQAEQAEAQKECGAEFLLELDAAGEPACQPKPKPEAAKAK